MSTIIHTRGQAFAQDTGWLDSMFAAFRQWRAAGRSRRELAQLDDYQLHDIGLSRGDAQFEGARFFVRD